MSENKFEKVFKCAISASAETVGGKWKPSILMHLKDHTHRFGELQRAVGVSHKVLSQQLKELEEDGIVRRQVYAEVPPRVEYSLSEYGKTLQPLLDALQAWGQAHRLRCQPAEATTSSAADLSVGQPLVEQA
jgi:DNA-binding HxlR family transcriptional regulator